MHLDPNQVSKLETSLFSFLIPRRGRNCGKAMGDPQDAALRALVASLDLKKPRPPPIAVLSRRLMETLLVRDFCIRRATDSWEYKAWYSKTGECEWAGARHNLRATRAATGAEAASTQAMVSAHPPY